MISSSTTIRRANSVYLRVLLAVGEMINEDCVHILSAIDLKDWTIQSIVFPLDEHTLIIKHKLVVLCEKHIKLLSKTKPLCNLPPEEVLKRRKILSELKCIPTHVKKILSSTLSPIIFLFKAVEEICFHGLRSCQRYITELQFVRKEVESGISQILNEKEYLFTVSKINKLIGPYLKKYESLSYFLKRADETSVEEYESYGHPKFKYLEFITKKYFETFKNGMVIVLCESSFCKLEICNFLVKFKPLIKPMIFLSSDKQAFSQNAKDSVREMFELRLCNVLVTNCNDSKEIDFEAADLLIHFDVEQHLTNYDVFQLNEENLHQKLVLFLNKKLEETKKMSFVKSITALSSGVNLGETSDGKRKYIDYRSGCAMKKMKNEKVQNNLVKKNFFESAFDSFEFDDGFLMKVDAEVRKDGGKVQATRLVHSNSKSQGENVTKVEEGKSDCKQKLYSDFHLSIGDLNDSDFFDIDIKVDAKVSSKVSSNSTPSFKQKNDGINSAFIDGLSPIHGAMLTKNISKNGSFSSTPIRKNSLKLENEEKENKVSNNFTNTKDPVKEAGYKFEDADLFEDWDDEDFQVKSVKKDEGDLITLSQAVELMKEADSAKEVIESDEEDVTNRSVDLLTGEVIQPNAEDIGNLFSESFNLPKAEPLEKKSESFLIVEEFVEKKQVEDLLKEEKVCDSPCIGTSRVRFDGRNKPSAAQKLDFGDSRCSNSKETYNHEKCSADENIEIYFISDDDFDEFTQVREAEKNSKSVKCDNTVSGLKNSSVVFSKSVKSTTPFKESDVSDESIRLVRKKGKCRVVESDTTEDSPSPKFLRNIKKKSKNKTSEWNEFIDLEAEVSDEVDFSSDEADEDGEFEKSFLDEASYCTQNHSADMTAKYLESLKAVENRPGTFKIPKPKPYNPVEVFSQIPDDSNVDYELDSFCVKDVDEETKTDLSDLEIAEKVLEMDRRKRRKKRATERLRCKNLKEEKESDSDEEDNYGDW